MNCKSAVYGYNVNQAGASIDEGGRPSMFSQKTIKTIQDEKLLSSLLTAQVDETSNRTETIQPVDNPSNNIVDQEKKKLLFEAFLEKARQVKSEMVAIQSAQRSIINYAIGIIGVVVPILIAALSTSQSNFQLYVIVFVVLSVLYEFAALIYIGLTRGILRLSEYLLGYLSPQINELLGLKSPIVFQWERFVRQEIRKPIFKLVGFALYTTGEFALIIGPSLVSIVSALFITYQYSAFTIFHWIYIAIYVVLFITIVVFALVTLVQSRNIPQRFLPKP